MKITITVEMADMSYLEVADSWCNRRMNISLSSLFREQLGIELVGRINIDRVRDPEPDFPDEYGVGMAAMFCDICGARAANWTKENDGRTRCLKGHLFDPQKMGYVIEERSETRRTS